MSSKVSVSHYQSSGSQSEWNDRAAGLCLALLIGMHRQHKLQASIMAIIACVLIVGGTLTPSFITLFDGNVAPYDFNQKGTISNLAQDATTPHGRLWATALIVSSILLLFSMYPFWLYRCWEPWHTFEENPIVHGAFQSKRERVVRSVWLVVPHVGFILTGAVPSLSGVHGYKLALTGVHNTCAVLSMLVFMAMETIQLAYGENAFRAFFSSKPATSVYSPLNLGQRVRVVTVTLAWLFGVVFVAVQAYLHFFTNTQRWVAQLSYFCEVSGMTLAFTLPALAGIFYLIDMEEGTVLEEMNALIGNHLSGDRQHSSNGFPGGEHTTEAGETEIERKEK